MSRKKERETRTKKDVINSLHEYPIPDGAMGEYIAQVLAPAGNNLHSIRTPDGEESLISMPNKFRKNIWIKRGDFVIASPIEEGDKVTAEIAHVLTKDHVRHLRQRGLWPPAFDTRSEAALSEEETRETDKGGASGGSGQAAGAAGSSQDAPVCGDDSESSEDDYGDLTPNVNHRPSWEEDEEEDSD